MYGTDVCGVVRLTVRAVAGGRLVGVIVRVACGAVCYVVV